VICSCIDADDWFEVLYHFSYDQLGFIITVKAFIRDRENPAVESITPSVPGAEWIEREMHDVMGIEFRNHPDMRRLILADDWPEGVYPERKEAKT
jgi:Ni,Fe-hydrogenase III component G